ncbi:MAG: hypothetical protein HRT56_01785, partial [Coraliomargarita sp.]|nr:hypothetical protein [Coraliomargarita sp.]
VTLETGEHAAGVDYNSLSIDLPLYASVAEVDLHDLGLELPRLQYSGNLTANNGAQISFAAPDAELLERIGSFDINEFASALGGVALSLGEVVSDALTNFDIPFTDLSFQDAVDAGTAFAQQFLSEFNFAELNSLQDILAVFADRFGAEVMYATDTQILHIPVDVALRIFRDTAVDLGFDYDFGDLASLETSLKAVLDSKLEGGLDFFVSFASETPELSVLGNLSAGFEFRADPVDGNPFARAALGPLEISAGAGSFLEVVAGVDISLDDSGEAVALGDLIAAPSDFLDLSLSAGNRAEGELRGLSVVAGGVEIFSATTVIGFSLSDFSNLSSFDYTVSDPEDASVVDFATLGLSGLGSLDFSTLIEGLGFAFEQIEELLADHPFYTQGLPFLDVSLEDVLDFGVGLAQRLQSAEVENGQEATLEAFEFTIEQVFNLTDENFGLSFNDNDSSIIDVVFNYGLEISEALAFRLDIEKLKPLLAAIDPTLVDRLEGISDFTDSLNGGGALSLTAGAILNLEFGIDTDADVGMGEDRFFIYGGGANDGTRLTLEAEVDASDLDLTFDFGQFQLGVDGGRARIFQDDNGVDAPASLTLFLADDNGALERYTDLGVIGESLDATLSGTFAVDLPIAVLTGGATHPLGSFSLSIVPAANADDALEALMHYLEDTEDSARVLALLPFVEVGVPDLVSVLGNFSLLSLINDPTVVIDGIDLALGALQDVFEGLVADDLPLIGSKASGAASFLRDIRLNLLSELRRDLANRPPVAFVQQTLFDLLGPAWLGVLQ